MGTCYSFNAKLPSQQEDKDEPAMFAVTGEKFGLTLVGGNLKLLALFGAF